MWGSPCRGRSGVQVLEQTFESLVSGQILELSPSLSPGGLARALSVTLSAPSGLDDPGRVDTDPGTGGARLRRHGWLRPRCRPSWPVPAREELDVVLAAQRGRGVAAQVALARRESHHRGQRHLGLAKIVATSCPAPGRVAGGPAHRVEGDARRARDRVPHAGGPRGRRRRGGGRRGSVEGMGDRDWRGVPAGGLPARPRSLRDPPPGGGARPQRHAAAGARHDDLAHGSAAGQGRRRGLRRPHSRGRLRARRRRPPDQGPGDGRHPRRLRAGATSTPRAPPVGAAPPPEDAAGRSAPDLAWAW